MTGLCVVCKMVVMMARYRAGESKTGRPLMIKHAIELEVYEEKGDG